MKRIILLFSLFISFSVINNQSSIAQKQGQQKLDSLIQELDNYLIEDSSRVNLLSVISFEYYRSNPDKGKEYAEEGISIAEKIDFKMGLANCYRSLGINYTVESNYAKALENLFLAYKIFEEIGDKKGIASILGALGSVYRSQKNYTKALEYYFNALKINEELGITKDIAVNYGNIANVYNMQSDYSIALDYYLKALKIAEQSDEKANVATILGNIGSLFVHQKDYQKALEYHLKSLNINKELKNRSGKMFNLGAIGMIYYFMANDTLNSVNNKNKLISKSKVDIYLNQSAEYLLKSIEIGREINANTELISWYKTLAAVYSKLKLWDKAYQYCSQSLELNQSVFSEQSQNKITSLENQQERELKDKEIKIQKLELDRRQLIIFFIIGALILISFLAFLIYTRFRNKKKSNYILETKNKLISVQNQEISLKNDQLVELNESKDKYLNMLKMELEHAANYVKSLIPAPINAGSIKARSFYIPSLDIGGDSLGYHWVDDIHFSFYLFDVSGHGIKAALHSVSILNNLKNQTLPNANFYSPKDVLMKLNNFYQMSKHNNLFFTIWYGVLNTKTKVLTYSSAGHPYALYIFGDNNYHTLGIENPLIGGFHNFDFLDSKVLIEDKSVIYIYSDGVYEIIKPDSTIWDQSELDQFLLENHNNVDGSELENLYQYAQDLHSSKHLDDDFSILKIEIDF